MTRGKREQIVRGALRLYRTRAVCGSTLKDVAAASGVPLGNLYYYFQTREELLLAVLDACEAELRGLLDDLAPLPPPAWLHAYFGWLLTDPDSAAHGGCPFGTLAVELRALRDPAAPRAAQIVQHYREAVAARTRTVFPDSDPDEVFLAVQGAYTVARALDDPQLFQRRMDQLRGRLPLTPA
ncbi:TetR/AcrR family transcriptional regulator [Deinococcus sp. MIMF12]|uniref:TetR/AcrR family transcriptional regulator n=1 Tax=Deinococcus rhizophilus TaxID=3049544 RepID=A0ABT7JIH4_9DEIO|nr:TetR/AcrR family transcriptional regulator [Deinococcus rhizophilus]MDL2344862.1 TetR/AcrR family transcriptional regulator [Deinococcus rhizophilus]